MDRPYGICWADKDQRLDKDDFTSVLENLDAIFSNSLKQRRTKEAANEV